MEGVLSVYKEWRNLVRCIQELEIALWSERRPCLRMWPFGRRGTCSLTTYLTIGQSKWRGNPVRSVTTLNKNRRDCGDSLTRNSTLLLWGHNPSLCGFTTLRLGVLAAAY